ncbi:MULTISPECIES: hypothetical protein [Pseudovibrio]|uniref:hypothetical protein n=1 Tax=Stappiaceae TaxID=2821832 RepID=UPI002365536B|nr:MULTISPECIES: hypothetical protein [Pseudovibrio]MDD7909008.1 hypothetical protein [Pseudovibrio exalbescens]MDX5593671.1 hypothetical protein [Pseudovibrio sp. SPO723]
MSKALSETLADFTNATASAQSDVLEQSDVVAFLPKAYGEGGDWVNRVFEAYENGFSEGEEAAKAGCDARIEAMKQELDEKLETTQKAWKEEQGRILEEEIKRSLTILEERVSATVADILIPFLHEEARQKAILSLSQVLRRHLAGNKESVVEVSGPKDLFDLFQRSSGEMCHIMKYKETEDADLEVRVSDMTLSSGLADWLAELNETNQG